MSDTHIAAAHPPRRIYAAVGAQLFSRVGYNGSLNAHCNFRTIGSAILALLRFTTGHVVSCQVMQCHATSARSARQWNDRLGDPRAASLHDRYCRVMSGHAMSCNGTIGSAILALLRFTTGARARARSARAWFRAARDRVTVSPRSKRKQRTRSSSVDAVCANTSSALSPDWLACLLGCRVVSSLSTATDRLVC